MSRYAGFMGLGASACLAVLLPVAAWADESPAVERPRTVLKVPTPGLVDERAVATHPLRPVVTLAADAYKRIRRDVRDYTCVMVRRERVEGRLRPHEFIYAKVRHRQLDGDRVVVPFSVYLKFLKPASVGGREVLYVEGQNGGEMFARRGGTRFAFVTTSLHPESDLAMRGNRYPVTEFGIENLVYRLLESARRDLRTHCHVEMLTDAKINSRPAQGIIVKYRVPEDRPEYCEARIFVDKELGLPIHFEAYDWPKEAGGEPQILEQYTYTQLQVNLGLTDADFSADNPQYHVK